MTGWTSIIRFWWVPILLALVAALALTRMTLDSRTADRDRWIAVAGLERAAHDDSKKRWQAATKAAQLAADRNLARVQSEQATISERTARDYQARLSDVDARYDRLRAQLAARSDLRSADLAPVSITAAAACRAYAGTGCDEIPSRLRAAERQTVQLVALQDWVREQSDVVTAPAEK